MKRRTFLAAASVLGAASTLSACSGQEKSGEELNKDTKAELTLFYWDNNQTPTIEANIQAFTKEYPNITITPSVAAYKDYWTKLRTQAEGDQLPDVFWMNGPNIQLYASNGMLAEIDDLKDVAWDKYPKALVDLYTVEGKKYGAPKDYDTIACFINKEIFAKAGVQVPTGEWTWEEHHAAAKAIADAQAGFGVVVGLDDAQSSYYNTIHQAGGYVIKDGKSGFDDPKSIEGVQYWADLVKDGSMPDMQVLADTPAKQQFLNGQAGIFWSGSWMVRSRPPSSTVWPTSPRRSRRTSLPPRRWSGRSAARPRLRPKRPTAPRSRLSAAPRPSGWSRPPAGTSTCSPRPRRPTRCPTRSRRTPPPGQTRKPASARCSPAR